MNIQRIKDCLNYYNERISPSDFYFNENDSNFNHPFILPEELRNGWIDVNQILSKFNYGNITDAKNAKNAKNVKNKIVHKHEDDFDIENFDHYNLSFSLSDSDEIFVSLSALNGIEFLMMEQDINTNHGINKIFKYTDELKYCKFDNCRSTENDIKYFISDYVHPLKISWFPHNFMLCSKHFNGEEVIKILSSFLLKDLCKIVHDYYYYSIYTMTRLDNSSKVKMEFDQIKSSKIKMEITSVITEWLPIIYAPFQSHNSTIILFLNCNPESKFYKYVFPFTHKSSWYEINSEPIHLSELVFK